ncbi:probable pectinesterase/pectinesterase inhibitor 21 [Rutidosis leptorrhynchoides]|uniref:probable pectinesterase/pectinesterase inhibitor 21 n=1 Tax=Rutidosis leptorrhynchoides TaxID=125765 RepID=UPI003A98E036
MGYSDDGGGKKKLTIIGVCSLILVAMVVAVAYGVNGNAEHTQKDGTSSGSGEISTSKKMIKNLCQPTEYKKTCEDSLNSAHPNTTDPKELIRIAFKLAMKSIDQAIENSTAIIKITEDPRAKDALNACKTLMNDSIFELKNSFDKMADFDLHDFEDLMEDVQMWLTSSYTYQDTCLDQFENTTGESGEKMKKILKTSMELTNNAFSMVDGLRSFVSSLNISSFSRRLIASENRSSPSWAQRRLLQVNPATRKPDVIVAKDGTGKYTTINEALKDIPLKRTKPFTIFVKAGIYAEYVTFTKDMDNVYLVGEGATTTIITGDRNFLDGITTVHTPTVAVLGKHFMAKDIGFENSAGPKKHQAVALRVAGDFSIFYNCTMYGYQDTLYVHAGRQFYRDCTVYGTIDFVFGNGAVVMQNCKFIIRKPLENQACMVTAHGRKERTVHTGLVIQDSTITGEPDYMLVKDVNQAYLGRPWKIYSRTVIMNTNIDSVIAPEGWFPWAGDVGLNSCFYAEYNNSGAGAAQVGRVTWKGVKKLTAAQVHKYTAEVFLRGDRWVKLSGVPYKPGM